MYLQIYWDCRKSSQYFETQVQFNLFIINLNYSLVISTTTYKTIIFTLPQNILNMILTPDLKTILKMDQQLLILYQQ